MERSNISAKRSPPATMMSHVAIKKRCAEIQAPTPPSSRPRIVLMTWSVAQTTDVVRLRAFSEVTLERPMAQAVISATQRRTSTGLGIDLLVGAFHDGSAFDHPSGDHRAFCEGRSVRPVVAHRRHGDHRGLVAYGGLRAHFRPGTAVTSRPAGPGRDVRKRAGRDQRFQPMTR